MNNFTLLLHSLIKPFFTKRLLLTFLAVLGLFYANATNYVSTATGGNWNTAGSWVGGVIPSGAATDVVEIVNGATINNTTSTIELGSVTIDAGGTLKLTAQLTIGNSGGVNGITINGTLLQSSNYITVNGPWIFNTGATFTPGNYQVVLGTGGSIGGTAVTTFYILTISTTNSTDVVPIIPTSSGGPGGIIIATGNTKGVLNLTKGILKVGAANTITFAKDFTIARTGGNLANSLDGAGDADADGGTIIVSSGNGDNPGDIITGGPTIYNITNLNNDRLALDANSGVYMRVNGLFQIYGTGSNQFAVTGNSPIWGPNSTLYIDGAGQWNYSSFSILWNAAPGSTIGTTPGFPNNVTIANNNNNAGAISQSIPINGLLTIGDGVNTSVLTFSGGTAGAFYCSGFVENANSTVTLPGALFTTKGRFVVRGGTFNNNSGTVVMAGSGTCSTPDSIKLASGTFYNLTINNTAYTKLWSNVTVNNTLALPTSGSSGIIEVNGYTLSMTNTSNSAITGGGTNSFINGAVSWALGTNLASTTYIFPVGVSSSCTNTYLPFTITPQTSSASITATVQAFNTSSGGSGSITGISTTEYWALATSASLLSGSSVTIQRPSAITAGSIIAGSSGQAAANNSSYTSLGGTTSGSGPYSINNSNSIGTASPFYFAIANPSQVVTLPATSITTTGVTLNGTYNTGGVSVATSFTYGLGAADAGLGTPFTIHSPLTSTTAKADSAIISGLIPNTLYTYKATASIGSGADVSFTTLPNPPTANPGTNAASTSVTANWTAPTVQGAATFTYTVQISTDPTFATGVITQANIVSSTTNYTFTGLSPATAYYYRVEAVNVTGPSTWSSNIAISTLLAASSGCSSSGGASAGINYVTLANAPVIDGVGTDASWSTVTANSISKLSVGTSTDINNVAGGTYWKALWSADSLYLLVQVTDPGGLVSLPSSMGGVAVNGTAPYTPMNATRNYYDVDGVELVLDPNYTHTNTYTGNDDQLRFNLGANTLSGQSTGGATQFVGTAFLRTAAAGVTNFQILTSVISGNPVYTVEAAIPWSAIYGVAPPGTPANLQDMGFDISVNDNDNATGGRVAQVTWNNSNGTDFSNPTNFAQVALVGCETPPVVDKPTVTAITAVSATLGATVESGGADLNGNVFTSVPVIGTAYSTTLPVSTNALEIGGTFGPPLPAAFNGGRTALSPQTHYYYVGYATNTDNETGVSVPGSFWTLSSPPTTQVSSFLASTAACTGVTLNWTAAAFPKNLTIATDSGYIILRSTAATPSTAGIVNGATVTQAGITALQPGVTLVTTLLSGAVTYNDAGLASATYYYTIIPFTWNGSQDSTYNYLTASPATANIILGTTSGGGTVASAQTICSGSTMANLTLSGQTGTVTQWQYSSDNFVLDIHNIANTTTTLSGASVGALTSSTYFRAVVSSMSCPSANSSSVLITVLQPSTAPTVLNTSATICNGGSATLTQTGGSIGTNAYWQWYTDPGFTSPIGTQLTTGNASLTVSPTSTTTYYLRAEGGASPCAPTAGTNAISVTITVNQSSIAPTTLNSSVTLCNTGSQATTLTQTGGSLGTGAYWQWYTNAGFTVPVGGHLSSTDASLAVTPTTTTTYYLRAEGTSSPCATGAVAASGSVTVTVNQPSVVPGSLSASPTTLCSASGASTTLTENGGTLGTGAYWQWYTDAGYTMPVGGQLTGNASLTLMPTTTTTYYLRVEGATNPCTAIVAAGSITVTVGTRPTASVTSPNIIVCSPASATISGTIAITGSDAWKMTLSDGSIITGTGSGTWSKLVTPATTITYTIAALIDNTSGCSSIATDLTSSEVVTVITPSVTPTSLGGAISLCLSSSGLSGTATLSQTGGSLGTGAYWQWYSDPLYTIPVAGQLTSASATLSVAPTVTTTYYLRIEGGTSPCTTTIVAGNVTVTVNAASVAPTTLNASADTVCGTTSVTLTQTGGSLGTGAYWQWYSNSSYTTKVGGALSSANASLIVSVSATTTYYLRAEGTSSPCTVIVPGPAGVKVTVNALPTAQFNLTAATICSGTAKTFTVTLVSGTNYGNPPGWSYSWSDGTTTTVVPVTTGSPISPAVSLNPSVTTTYSLVAITDSKGCMATTFPLTKTLTVIPAESIITQPANTTACSGTATSISVVASNAASYTWQVSSNGGSSYSTVSNGGVYSNATTATLNIGNTTGFNTYLYKVVVNGTSPCTSATSSVAFLTVNLPVSITTQPVNTASCAGTPTSISVVASNAASYTWQVSTDGGLTYNTVNNVGVYSNATTATLNISDPTGLTGNWYRVVINGTAPCSTVTSSVAILMVSAPVSISTQPINTASCSGTATSISVVASNAASYTWLVSSNGGLSYSTVSNGGVYSNANMATLNISNPTGLNTYWYKVIVNGTSPCTSVTSSVAILTVSSPVSITTQPVNTASCAGTATSFSVVASNAASYTWQVSTNGGSTYSTVNNGGVYSNATTATLNISDPTGLTGNLYQVIVNGTAPCSSVSSSVVTLTVSQPSVAPTSLSASSTPICSGGSTTLTQNGGTLGTGATWKWYADNTFSTLVGTSVAANASLLVSPTTNTTYYLRAEGGSSPCTATVGTNTISVMVTVSSFRMWTGVTSSNWNDATNWCGGIPDVTTNVLIPNPSPNYPNLNTGAGATNNITIQSGASVTVSSTGILSIAGVISNSGTFDATTGTINMAGASAQTLDGSAFVSRTINNLTISNTAVSLVATASDTLKVSGALSFGNINNATFNTNNNLTLTSTAAATANVADITNGGSNSGNAITGSAVIERFVTSHRAWRLLTAPLKTTTQTINASWQEGVTNLATSGATQYNPNPGYGTEITNTIATPASTGYDKAVTNNPSLLYLNDAGTSWMVPTSTLTTSNVPLINSKPGYMLFIRGDRSVIVTTPPFHPSTTTVLRTKGTLNQNNVPMTAAGTGNQVVGNPYASQIGLDSVFDNYGGSGAGSIIGTNYIAWDPLLGGNAGVGAFYAVAWLGGNSYTTVDSYTPATLGKIESGQAFFFYFANTNPISFSEKNKSTQSVLVFRPANAINTLQTFGILLSSVNSDGSTDLDDGALELYGAQYSDSVNWLEDAEKIPNPGESLSILRDGEYMAIEKRQPIAITDTIFFNITNMQQQTYRFAFVGANLVLPQGIQARLQDLYLNTSTIVSLATGDTTYVNFTVNSNAASQGNRFRIVYDIPNGGPLPVTFTGVKAWQLNNKNINVQWTVQNELGIKNYIIEKSTDGQTFTDAATVMATGASLYNWEDVNAASGENYYRIISVGNTGVEQYSKIVNVLIGTGVAPGIAVYPNPVDKSGVIGLQMTNMPGGQYSIRLIDAIGQVILVKEITHTAGSSVETINFNKGMARGMYHLEINGPNNYRTDIKILY